MRTAAHNGLYHQRVGRKQRFILALVYCFCNSSDCVEKKRRQCFYVGVVLVAFVSCLAGCIVAVFNGTWTSNVQMYVALGIQLLALAHCRCTRGFHSARFFFVGILYYMTHFMVIRGGFSCVPQLVFTGLLAPLLSMFISDRSVEPGCWFGCFLFCIVAIRLVEVKELMPTPKIDARMIAQANCTNCIITASM